VVNQPTAFYPGQRELTDSTESPATIRVLGVRVNIIQTPEVVSRLEHWIRNRDSCRYVVATGMHGIMEAQRHPDFKAIVNAADLFVPDGISLIWTARRRGFKLKKRVCASDLMWEFFKHAEQKGYSSYFYGDTNDTLERLISTLRQSFPRLNIAGYHSPPFRPVTPEEDEQEIRMINESGADVVWVGLGLPKQERWMFEHVGKLRVPVLVGVGASFKFLSGQVKRAPQSLGDLGFEWLWRLLHEPRRVWQRVFFDAPRFVCHLMLEMSGLRKYH